ncbi:unnamed protein product, partial [Staurois parvus]
HRYLLEVRDRRGASPFGLGVSGRLACALSPLWTGVSGNRQAISTLCWGLSQGLQAIYPWAGGLRQAGRQSPPRLGGLRQLAGDLPLGLGVSGSWQVISPQLGSQAGGRQ